MNFAVINDKIVLDRWSAVIPQGHGLGQQLYWSVEALIEQWGAPGIQFQPRELAPSFIAGLLGERHPCMAIKNILSSKLRTFVIYIDATDSGDALIINWWLCSRMGLWYTLTVNGFYIILLLAKWNLRAVSWFFPRGLARTLVGKMSDLIPANKPTTPLTADPNIFERNIHLRGFLTTVHRALVQTTEELMTQLGQNPAHLNRTTGFLLLGIT